MAEKHEDQEFLEFIIKHIVDNPDDVKVNRKVDEMGVLLSLHVHADDMGAVIGKGGQTARAIRSLVRIVGLKNHARVNLRIEEPEGGKRAPRKSAPKKETKEEDTGLEDLKL